MKKPLNIRVLYVEDDPDSCDLVETMLRTHNIGVVSSGSIKNAWERALREAFDLYLLDGTVEDGTTLNLCRHLHKRSPETPILFYSGEAHDIEIDQCMAAGAVGYLVKPYFGDLAATVTSFVSNRSNTGQRVERAHFF